MKERYPFLAYWKKEGLTSFPSVPPSQIIEMISQPHLEKFREGFRRGCQKSLLLRLTSTPGNLQQLENEAAEIFLNKKIIPKFRELCEAKKEEVFQHWMEAQERIIYGGEKGKRVRGDFARKTLPNTKGGPATFLKIQKKVLKLIYHELYDCIKEVRPKLRIPLKRDKTAFAGIFPFSPWFSKKIRKIIPEIGDLFEDDELNLLVLHSSISMCCYKIILTRFDKSSTIRMSRSTLRKIIEETPLP